MTDPLAIEFHVDCSVDHAFDTWARRTSMWWPKSHSRSGHAELEVVIEDRVGGRIYERTPDGEEHDWGEVTAWEAPTRLAYLWHIYGSRAEVTHVEIQFTPAEDGTTVRIRHTGWDELGARGPDLRARNHTAWQSLLPAFVAACAPPA